MGVRYHKDIKSLEKALAQDAEEFQKRCQKAIEKAARRGRRFIIRETLPIAFRELEKSIHVLTKGGTVSIIADAPHAASVETGSRPHWAPLAPLIRWVKLRASQWHGATTDGKTSFGSKRGRGGKAGLRGTTTMDHAESIGVAMDFLASSRGGSNDADDAVKIARAIQVSIARKGTKPHWFMRRALPEIERILDEELSSVTSGGGGQGTGIDAGLRSSQNARMK